jgi:hypothetical protein
MKIASTLLLSVVLFGLFASTAIAAKLGQDCIYCESGNWFHPDECESYNSGCGSGLPGEPDVAVKRFPVWLCDESKVDKHCDQGKCCLQAHWKWYRAGTQQQCSEMIKEKKEYVYCCDGFLQDMETCLEETK